MKENFVNQKIKAIYNSSRKENTTKQAPNETKQNRKIKKGILNLFKNFFLMDPETSSG